MQFGLSLIWQEALKRGVSLPEIAELMAGKPADIAGIGDRLGRIAPGQQANFCVFDSDSRFTITPDRIHHRHKVTPYMGLELTGEVRATVLRGEVIYREGVFPGEASGRPIFHSAAGVACALEESTSLETLNEQETAVSLKQFSQCCSATRWATAMASARPFANADALFSTADRLWSEMSEADVLEAFDGHPQIGNVETLKEKYRSTLGRASHEQSGVNIASEETLSRLAIGNKAYLHKFGFIFIVCATGKSAEQMLALLEARLGNDRSTELTIAAAEQAKITRIRLEQLL